MEDEVELLKVALKEQSARWERLEKIEKQKKKGKQKTNEPFLAPEGRQNLNRT